jgi:pre-rRNA-processing protein IPI3
MQRHLTRSRLCGWAIKSESGVWNITSYDLSTGSPPFTLKQTLAGLHSTVATETRDGHGGLVLAPQLDKNLLNVYNFQSKGQQTVLLHC